MKSLKWTITLRARLLLIIVCAFSAAPINLSFAEDPELSDFPSAMTQTFIELHESIDPCREYNKKLKFPSSFKAFEDAGRIERMFITRWYYSRTENPGARRRCNLQTYYYDANASGILNVKTMNMKQIKILGSKIARRGATQRQRAHLEDIFEESHSFTDDDFGDECPLRINWIRYDSHEFAILSIISDKHFPFIEDSDFTKSDCMKWRKKEHRALIVSPILWQVSQLHDRRAVFAARDYPIGFALKNGIAFENGTDFICFEASDAFDLHVVAEREFFDENMRARLIAEDPSETLTQVARRQVDWLRKFAKSKGCVK